MQNDGRRAKRKGVGMDKRKRRVGDRRRAMGDGGNGSDQVG